MYTVQKDGQAGWRVDEQITLVKLRKTLHLTTVKLNCGRLATSAYISAVAKGETVDKSIYWDYCTNLITTLNTRITVHTTEQQHSTVKAKMLKKLIKNINFFYTSNKCSADDKEGNLKHAQFFDYNRDY